jgi:hypothetical protein
MAIHASTASLALLSLGRLDGQLVNSPAADLWMAQARLEGASSLAGQAGVPIPVAALQDWICGRSAPPRHSEGLDDPLSVAALFHFALSAGDAGKDPVARATLNLSRTLLDDRAEAALWAPDDLLRFGPLWREAQDRLTAPYPAPGLLPLAERLLEARAHMKTPQAATPIITSADGRQFRLPGRVNDIGWVLACHLPAALVAAGLAWRALPHLVSLPRHWPDDPPALSAAIEHMIGTQAADGLKSLRTLEGAVRKLPDVQNVTRRSRLPLLMRLQLVYPGLSRTAVARLLGVSHQGATKLLIQARGWQGGRHPLSTSTNISGRLQGL